MTTNYDEEVDIDVTYEFTISEKTSPDYRCCTSIISWIKTNLEELTDDYNHKIFSKVNYGYNTDTIKGFGKKPVADIYVDNVNYDSDFDDNKPSRVNSVIICYLKGNMNNVYFKACELTDYLVQQFEEEEDFRELDSVVRYTYVRNVRIQVNPNSKVYGVLCAFELEHKLYSM